MKKFLPLVIVVVLLLMVGGWFSGQYNGLVREDQEVKAAWSQVENVLQRRFDLIPNLVETVKGYASHERETLEAVTNARARVGGAGSVDEKIAANNELSSALSRLLVVVEQYPDLKANQGFIQLQDELAGTENRISVERGRYNQTAKVYNVKVKSFPTVVFANMMGFHEAKLFEAAAGAQTAPKVDFSK
ncbi:MAG: LemA family protein [Candidatus Eisenbacteria bacterium]